MVVFMFPETKWPAREHGHATTNNASTNQETIFENSSKQQDAALEKTGTDNELGHIDTAARDPWLGRGTPSKAQWGLYTPNPNPLRAIFLDLWIPWKLFAFPIVELAAFVVSWSCSSFLTLNLTQTQAFAAPPYNFTTEQIGFTNFAILIGAMIGLFTAGPLSDWVSTRQTIKNRGIREPEMRLLAMIPYVIIMYFGNIIVSVGYQHQWPWQAIVVLGYTSAGIQVAAIPGIVSTYAVDSYKPVAGSLFVAITVNKNVWGYGYSKFITVCFVGSFSLEIAWPNVSTGMDHCGWLHPTDHDERFSDPVFLSMRHHFLLLRKDIPALVEG